MTNSKKILITTESREIFIIRNRAESRLKRYCGRCGEETAMLTLEQVVTYAVTNTREMIRRIDEGRIHSLETADGQLLVCTGSIADSCQFTAGEKPTMRPTPAVKELDLIMRES